MNGKICLPCIKGNSSPHDYLSFEFKERNGVFPKHKDILEKWQIQTGCSFEEITKWWFEQKNDNSLVTSIKQDLDSSKDSDEIPDLDELGMNSAILKCELKLEPELDGSFNSSEIKTEIVDEIPDLEDSGQDMDLSCLPVKKEDIPDNDDDDDIPDFEQNLTLGIFFKIKS